MRTVDEENETVTITKEEYEDFLDDQKFLRALADAGVDNWTGYDLAVELLESWRNK